MIRALIMGISLLAASAGAATLTAEQFELDYNSLAIEIFINKGEVADIENFVYEKDVATFTFKKGRMLLQKPLNGRPTSAIFEGDAHIHIDIPPLVERRSFAGLTGDSAVDLSVQVLTIRFSDDFDLKLKEKFTFEDGGLSVAQAKKAKKDQGERFFKPDIRYTNDSYFQLLRSAYERAADGYFMAGFDRWSFLFDPNQDEELRIGYEQFRPSDFTQPAALFQRKESNIYDDLRIANIPRPLTIVKDSSIIFAGGMDGYKLISGQSFADFVVHDDSIKSLHFYVSDDTRIDSLSLDGSPLIFKRRRDFSFTGICLPKYYYRNDTVSIYLKTSNGDIWGAIPDKLGKDFTNHYVSLMFPRGYNYYGEGYSEVSRYDDSLDCVTIRVSDNVSGPSLTCRATGVDTSSAISSTGITLTYISGPSGNQYELKDGTKEMLDRALGFMQKTVGNPADIDELLVSFGLSSSSGWIRITNNDGSPEKWGQPMLVGGEVAYQWFGSKVRTLSYRDYWIKKAVTGFLALMFTQEERGDEVYYRNLVARKAALKKFFDEVGSTPVAGGHMPAHHEASQGVWVLHMLRCMMQDLQTGSDERFLEFLRELIVTAHMRPITTADFVEMAERHVGGKMAWFFDQFLFGTDIPDYKVEYKITEEADGNYFNFDVKTEKVGENFVMLVLIRLDFEEGTSYVRQPIAGNEYSFRLGPYSYKPTGAFFNEMLSVLSDYELKEK